MPYQVKSTDIWFNAPGVIAAYQPVSAPGPLLARYNQAHGGSNLYQAVGGVAPSWSAHTGWTFDGGTQYLATGLTITNNGTWTALAQYSNATLTAGGHALFGMYQSAPAAAFLVQLDDAGTWSASGTNYPAGYARNTSATTAAGNYGFAGKTIYRNGSAESVSIPTGTGDDREIYLGAVNTNAGITNYWIGNIYATVIASITVSPAHIAQYVRQMAYCHANPDWSAWGRRRRYYYAPEFVAPPVTADDLTAAAARMGAFGPRLGGAARTGQQQAAPLPAAARAGHRSRLNG